MMLHTATQIGRSPALHTAADRAEALRVLDGWLSDHVKSATLLTWDRRRYVADLRASLSPVSSDQIAA